MNELMSDPSTQLDCTSSSGSIAWAPNDVYSQVKGPEHSGRVCGLRFRPTPSGRNTKTRNVLSYTLIVWLWKWDWHFTSTYMLLVMSN